MRRAGEDYLQAILLLEEEHGGEGVRITDLAEKLGVSKPSVNRAMKNLREEGCIEQESYGEIYLSGKGRAVAEDIFFRHSTLLRFFTEVLEVSPGTAEKDACMVEHDISPESLEKLLSYMQGEKGKGQCGPGLVDMVGHAITDWLDEEVRAGRIASYEERFSDHYSPWAFRYVRGDGSTVYCLLKYESFDRSKIDIKCKMVNFVLEDPERVTELWYVRRKGSGRTLSVSTKIGSVIRELNGVLNDAGEKMQDRRCSLGCYKLSCAIENLELEDRIEF